MAVKFLAGNRLWGSNAERLALPTTSTAWTVADANNDDLTLNDSTWKAVGMRVESGNSNIGKILTKFTIKVKRYSADTSANPVIFGVWTSTSTSDTPVSAFTVAGVSTIADLNTTAQTYTAVGSRILAENDVIGILADSDDSDGRAVLVINADTPSLPDDMVDYKKNGDNWVDAVGDTGMIGVGTTSIYPELVNGTIFVTSDTNVHYMWNGTDTWNEVA